jgi:hypothetical protein
MNRNNPFFRKIVYAISIVVLLVPLFWLGQPASTSEDGVTQGGQLAQLRKLHNLSQAELGEIDPTSESMKLATLGLRGPAANFLWQKALMYQRRKNWDALSATVNQIIRLQPNFIGVWEFQSHNLSYNVSADFDDYRHRYHWVKKGIDFLCLGNRYNRDQPRLLHFTGWFIGQKIGISDEKVQFREMFRNDRDYHDTLTEEMATFRVDMDSQDARGRHDQKPDNWLVGRLWYLQAVRAVDDLGKSLRGKSPLIFHSDPAKSQMNFADALEDEGNFGEVAQRAWVRGGEEWELFAKHSIPSSWGVTIRLNQVDEFSTTISDLRQKLKSITPGVEDAIIARRMKEMPPEHLAIWNTPKDARSHFTFDDWNVSNELDRKLFVSNGQIAKEAPESVRENAQHIARELNRNVQAMRRVNVYRDTVNYDYWYTRCMVEQTVFAASAREHGFKALDHYEEARLELAKEEFEACWKDWLIVFGKFPALRSHETRGELERQMRAYKQTLVHLGEDEPEFVKELAWIDSDEHIEAAYGSEEQRAMARAASNATPKEESPKEESPKEESPKEESPKEESPKEESPKEESPKEESPKEESPKEESPKEESPKV